MRTTRKDLERLVDALNKRINGKYRLNYVPHYGGYALEWSEDHRLKNTCLYEHGQRRSAAEMRAYLLGALHVLQDLSINKEIENYSQKD